MFECSKGKDAALLLSQAQVTPSVSMSLKFIVNCIHIPLICTSETY